MIIIFPYRNSYEIIIVGIYRYIFHTQYNIVTSIVLFAPLLQKVKMMNYRDNSYCFSIIADRVSYYRSNAYTSIYIPAHTTGWLPAFPLENPTYENRKPTFVN